MHGYNLALMQTYIIEPLYSRAVYIQSVDWTTAWTYPFTWKCTSKSVDGKLYSMRFLVYGKESLGKKSPFIEGLQLRYSPQ